MSCAVLNAHASPSRPRRGRRRDLDRRHAHTHASNSPNVQVGETRVSSAAGNDARIIARGGGSETSSEAHVVTPPRSVNYVVARGDSLFSIASSHGVLPDDIVAANALHVRRSIEVGQTLQVPVNVHRASYAVKAKLNFTDSRLGTTPATRSIWSLAPRRSERDAMMKSLGSGRHAALPSVQILGVGFFAVAIALLRYARKPSEVGTEREWEHPQKSLRYDTESSFNEVLAPDGIGSVGESDAKSGPVETSVSETLRWVGEASFDVAQDSSKTAAAEPVRCESTDNVDGVAQPDVKVIEETQRAARRLETSPDATRRDVAHSVSWLPALVGRGVYECESVFNRLGRLVKRSGAD